MKYGNKILYSFALLAATFTSCNHDDIDELKFDVSLDNSSQTVKVGEPVTFNFSGEPDYLVFYSGEFGKKYKYRNRHQADIEDFTLRYDLELKYAMLNYRNGLRVLVSEDFNGTYDETSINAATWSDMDGQLQVPVITSNYTGYQHGEVRNVTVNMSAYKDKKFYLALEYNMPALTADELTNNSSHPDAFFYPKLYYTIDGKTASKTSPKNDFNFGFAKLVANSNSSDNPTVTNVDDTKVSINGRRGRYGTHIWTISQPIDAGKVSADEGVSIKSYSYNLPNYTYIYTEPGKYTATFVARNANAWNSQEEVKEIEITVVE